MNINDLEYIKKINGISHNNCNCKSDMINEMVDEYEEAYDNVVTRFEVLINTKSAIDVYVNDSETPIKALYYTKKKQGATTEREEGIQVYPNQIKQGDILRFSYNDTDIPPRYYMVLSSIEKKRGYDEGIVVECNIMLNWEGLDKPIPAIFINSSYGAKGETNSYEQMSEFDSRGIFYIQKNDKTKVIYNGMRFVFNSNENDIYQVTKVQGVFAEGYYNDVVKYCKRVQEDDLENNIAYNPRLKQIINNNKDKYKEIITITGKDIIKLNQEETYTVDNYSKEVYFTFDEETISTNCVELISQSDNQCVIKGLIKNEWIVLLCKDKETDETLCITSIFIK